MPKSSYLSKVSLLLCFTLSLANSKPAKAADPVNVGLAIVAACGAGIAAMATLSGPVGRVLQKRRLRQALLDRGAESSRLETNLELAWRLLRNVPDEEAAILRLFREVETPELLTANLEWHVEQFEAAPDGFFDPESWFQSIGLREPTFARLKSEGWQFLAFRGSLDKEGELAVIPEFKNKIFLVRLKPMAAPVMFDLLESAYYLEAGEALHAREERVYQWVCNRLLGGFQPCDPAATLESALPSGVIERVIRGGPQGATAFVVNAANAGENAREIVSALKLLAEQSQETVQSQRLSNLVFTYLIGKHARMQALQVHRSLIMRRLEFQGRHWQNEFNDAATAGMKVEEYYSGKLIRALGIDKHPKAAGFLPTLVRAKFQDFF